MSIVIKGIDMPKCSNEDIMVVIRRDKAEVWQTGYKERTVEAIQIPTPHGRLIDGDEFKSWVDDWYDCTDIGNIVESWIDERPTILEEEK